MGVLPEAKGYAASYPAFQPAFRGLIKDITEAGTVADSIRSLQRVAAKYAIPKVDLCEGSKQLEVFT